MGRRTGHRLSAALLGWALLLWGGSERGVEGQFQNVPNQCTVQVGGDLMKQLGRMTEGRQLTCDNTWTTLLLTFHETRKNLTGCLEREQRNANDEPSTTFCQTLLDDAKRQAQQERAKLSADADRNAQAVQLDLNKVRDDARKVQAELDVVKRAQREYCLELVVTNIGIGDAKQAHKYHTLYTQGQPADRTAYEEMVQFVYRKVEYQNVRVGYMLDFARQLNDANMRLLIYERLHEQMLKRPNIAEQEGLAVVLAFDALDATTDAPALTAQLQALYMKAFDPVIKRWKQQLTVGEWRAVALFGQAYPAYFKRIQTQLMTVDANVWKTMDFPKFLLTINTIPSSDIRLESFRLVFEQVKRYNKDNPDTHLKALARETEVFERFIERKKLGQDAQDRLTKVKEMFKGFGQNKDYEHYLKEARNAKGRRR
ncbi:uncharacterized protein LOC131214046 [Anopheles bellator]|uniref:uncharacterized protein LOC131214046 n=1 Tax=Anopheles bellator TaxID=139047 RepID=UPI002649F5D2|nr:uncharacterized protein LOC131214046 [Anopheles bellator]